MVVAVRKGRSMRAVAAEAGVALRTVQRWVARAEGQRLDRVDWSGSRGGRRVEQATPREVEEWILELRRELRDSSDLGEFGAAAIHRELIERKPARIARVPSVRTIGRILERNGALDGRRRVRWPSPSKGWYLPDVSGRRAESDSFDIVEGLVIKGGIHVEVLNGISLHGGLTMSRVHDVCTSKFTLETVLVPEPSSYALLLSALAGLGLFVVRRKRSRK